MKESHTPRSGDVGNSRRVGNAIKTANCPGKTRSQERTQKAAGSQGMTELNPNGGYKEQSAINLNSGQ